jgi:hypothetical protein
MRMEDCPKFNRCSAPICPLDPDVLSRTYLPGEPVCLYMREFVKPDAKDRFQGAQRGDLYDHLSHSLETLLDRYAPLRKALKRASKTGSKLGKQPGRSIA